MKQQGKANKKQRKQKEQRGNTRKHRETTTETKRTG